MSPDANATRTRVAREAARLLTQASARFRDARASADPDKAAQLRAEGHVRLRQLRKYDAAAWPWARWIDEAERVEYLVPPDGEAPVYEGLRVAIPDAYNPDAIKYYEFGRLVASDGPPCIGVRASRTARWVCQNLQAVKALKVRPEHMPGGSVPWDSQDEAAIAGALAERVEAWARSQPVEWRGLGLTSASDAWLERWWPLAEPRVREVLSVQAEPETVPVLEGGTLSLGQGAEVRGGVLMPPTLAGWQQFLALAPASGASFTDLKEAGELWWARRIPQNLLAAARADEAPTTADRPSPELVAAERPKQEAAAPAATERTGHVYQLGEEWYGDTAFINALPFPVSHAGYGDFIAKAPGGTLSIHRYSDEATMPKQSGRLHRLTYAAGPAALGALIRELIESGRIELVAAGPPSATGAAPAEEPRTSEPATSTTTVAHLYQIEGGTYADEPILRLLKVHPVSKVDYSTGPLSLAWFRREDPLPEQHGRLYLLRHEGGARGLAVLLNALLETGALKFVGGWSSWDAIGDEPTHVQFRPVERGPASLLPPGLEDIL